MGLHTQHITSEFMHLKHIKGTIWNEWCIITGGIGHFKLIKQLTASSLTFFTRLFSFMFTPNKDCASYGDGEYTEDLMPIISDSIWTKIYSKVTFRVALILKKNNLWHLLLFFFSTKRHEQQSLQMGMHTGQKQNGRIKVVRFNTSLLSQI